MTVDQAQAIEQLEEIEQRSLGQLTIIRKIELDQSLVVEISIDCDQYDRSEGGLPLRSRERIEIHIDRDFPFRVPHAFTLHNRFAGYPHVQWGGSFCLYQSVATEWDASEGMFGFMERLDHWLKRGAENQFETGGEPLHPPVAYSRANTPMVIMRCDTPGVHKEPWIGFARLECKSKGRIDVQGWSPEIALGANAAVVLLNSLLPWEYPATGKAMLDLLESAGVSTDALLTHVAAAAASLVEDQPLLLIIGTPMRGRADSDHHSQHLTAWQFFPEVAQSLRNTLPKEYDSQELQDLRKDLFAMLRQCVCEAEISWCGVRDIRPEIATERDADTPMKWFREKVVSIWGCGAIGAAVAECVVRAGAAKVILYDSASVSPGVIVRQSYVDDDIGESKVDALAKYLRTIRASGLEVIPIKADLLTTPLEESDWTSAADIVIDASTSVTVLEKLERRLHRQQSRRVPSMSMVVGHRAQNGFVVVAGSKYSGGLSDVTRHAKIAICNQAEYQHFADEFWPKSLRHPLFQPEPGCSNPTFIGSRADVFALVGAMLNLAIQDVRNIDADNASASFLIQPHVHRSGSQSRHAHFVWQPDIVINDPRSDYSIRFAHHAWREICGWIGSGRRANGPLSETGGILFGERNVASQVLWVSEVIGPPPDSSFSPELFICGTEGLSGIAEAKKDRSRSSIQFIGMWHTHPVSAPLPSTTDLSGVQNILNEACTPSFFLLMIIGRTARSIEWEVGAFTFNRKETLGRGLIDLTGYHPDRLSCKPAQSSIGLALSGGGSRAIAFHLGCLRALHDLGLLNQVRVISSVSGGSVIGAMYAYSNDSFEEFEQRVARLLRRGLTKAIVRRTLLSIHTPKTLLSICVAGSAALGARVLQILLNRAAYPIRKRQHKGQRDGIDRIRPPFRRWRSRTHAFESALAKLLFGEVKLSSVARPGLRVIINACELRTGTAFRFGSAESGNWRFHRVADNDIQVAHAVAASAAYPALLPAFDERLEFEDRKGMRSYKRVILTDGGVFDNLGVSCLDPDKSSNHSYNAVRVDYVISCDAATGQFDDNAVPYGWATRMTRSFETVFRKVQDSTRQRLHELVRDRRLKGFVFSYLGQQDHRLEEAPVDLVPRRDVCAYPTDFSAMSTEMIELLAKRGEQLTRCLIARYCSDL